MWKTQLHNLWWGVLGGSSYFWFSIRDSVRVEFLVQEQTNKKQGVITLKIIQVAKKLLPALRYLDKAEDFCEER